MVTSFNDVWQTSSPEGASSQEEQELKNFWLKSEGGLNCIFRRYIAYSLFSCTFSS